MRQGPGGEADGDADAGSLVLLDCREPEELAAARIAGALHVPMGEVPARLQELAEHAEDCVVVFCHHGQRSMLVVAYLRKQGFEDVYSLAAGIDGWSKAVDPTVPRY